MSGPSPRPERWLASGLAGLALVATLGEGGAAPGPLLLVHGWIVALTLGALVFPLARPARPADPPLAAFAGFVALAVAGSAVTPYAYASLLILLEIASFLAVALLAAACGSALLRVLPVALLLGALVQGTTALVQRVVVGEARPAGTFLNANHLGAWLVAALFVGLAASGPLRGRGGLALRLAAALAASAGLFLCGSRGALLGLLAGAAWWLAQGWTTLEPRVRRRVVAGASVLVVLAGVGVVARFRSPDPFPFQRIGIWAGALRAAADRPWTGTGPGQFSAAAANLNFPVERGPLRFERFFTTTHSDVLRVPAEFGWPAALLLFAAAVLAAREIRRRRSTGPSRAERVGAVAALVALGAQATVDNLSERPALYLLAALLLGALLSRPGGSARWSVSARAVAAVVLVLGFFVADFAPYLAWSESRLLPRRGLDDARRRVLDRSLARNPIHPDLWLRRAETLEEAEGRLTLSGYADARSAAERAVRLQPADAMYRLGLARIEARACLNLFRDEASRGRAARRYEEAAARSRYDPFLELEKGWFLLSAADAAGARRAAERALEIEPEAVPARLLLAAAALDEKGPDARGIASTRLAEAESVARRWRDWPKHTAYARNLLTIDPGRAERIRSRMREDGGRVTDRAPRIRPNRGNLRTGS